MVLNGILIICGICLVASGVRNTFGKKSPWDAVGAFLAIVGLIVSLVGVLLVCVPDFFG